MTDFVRRALQALLLFLACAVWGLLELAFILSPFVLLFWLEYAHAVPAFPGCEGFGCETTCGAGPTRGSTNTKWCKVDTLSTGIVNNGTDPDDGAYTGSLSYCLGLGSNTKIVFEVSGVIRYNGTLTVSGNYVTIAGETAPPPGIALKQTRLQISGSDVCVRHISAWMGSEAGNPGCNTRDTLFITGGPRIAISNGEFAFGVDENVDVFGPVTDLTIQKSIIANGLMNSCHRDETQASQPLEPHSMAIRLDDAADRISIHDNFFPNDNQRHPRTRMGDLQWHNNVVYNFGQILADISSSTGRMRYEWVGNYYRPGPDSTEGQMGFRTTPPTADSDFFVSGNYWHDASPAFEDWTRIDGITQAAYGVGAAMLSPTYPITQRSALTTWQDYITNEGNIGPFPHYRKLNGYEPATTLINQAKNNTGNIIDCVTSSTIASSTNCAQRWGAAWPDRASNLRRLTIPANKNTLNPATGYTYGEEWLHAYMSDVENGPQLGGGTPTPTPTHTPTATNTPTNTTTPTPTPTTPPAGEDFLVQRGPATFGASGDSTTPPINAVGNLEDAFAFLTNVRNATSFPGANTTAQKFNPDLGALAALTTASSTSGLTLSRDAAGEDADTLAAYQIAEYIGPDGGANQWIKREEKTVTIPSGTSSRHFAIAGVSDLSKLWCRVAGVTHAAAAASEWDRALVTAEAIDDATNGKGCTLTRGDSSGDLTVRLVGIELTGSNWVVQNNISLTLANPSTAADEPVTITDLGTNGWDRAFADCTYRTNQANQNEIGFTWRPGTSTSLILKRVSGADSTGVAVCTVIKNAQGTACHISGQHASTGNELDVDISSCGFSTLTRILALCSADSAGTGTSSYPQNFWNYRLTSTSNLRWNRPRTGNVSNYACDLFSLPSAAPTPTPTPTFTPTLTPTLTLTATNTPTPSLLISDGFNGSASASWSETVFDTDHYSPSTSAQRYTTSPTPHEGTHALHYFALSGTNEEIPFKFQYNLPASRDELYVEWMQYVDSDYCWPDGSQKLIRAGYYDDAHPESQKEVNVIVQTSNTDVNLQVFCGAWGNSSLCSTDFAVHSDEAHPEDAWVRWSLHIRLNTPGSTNGFVRLYKNSSLYLDSGARNIRGTDTRGLNYFWIGGNYSMAGGVGTLACDGSAYVDDLVAWDQKPISLPPTPTFTPTATYTPTSTPTPWPTPYRERLRQKRMFNSRKSVNRW